jgi:4-hydroxy-2-oxoheptanedioate aldolase
MNATKGQPKRCLADRIRARELLIGLVVKMPCPAVIEAAGHAGFDLVVIDTEHGVGDTGDLEHHLRAAESVRVAALVRVGSNEPLQILRALDAGATGVIVPHVDSPADALKAARAAHYPPEGVRGLAVSTRAGHQSLHTMAEHLERARRETVVIAQIEDRRAIEWSRGIAATPRMDAVWVGPSDLSMSLGHPGELTHPEVVGSVDAIVEGVNGADRAALCVLVDSEDEVAAWKARGATVALFAATGLFASRFSELIRRTRGDAAPPPLSVTSKDAHV